MRALTDLTKDDQIKSWKNRCDVLESDIEEKGQYITKLVAENRRLELAVEWANTRVHEYVGETEDARAEVAKLRQALETASFPTQHQRAET